MINKILISLICGAVVANTAAPETGTNITEYGTCKVTAYSGTNGVTYGASENILIPNVSCAASREIPLGTLLYIEDYGVVVVDDRMSEEYDTNNGGMVIDLYLESYEAACEWGMHELDVYVINENIEEG